jgi:broad specificity phosphatase PhoE
MTQLLLIRHGQSTWNAQGRIQGWADPPLDEIGHDQAGKLANRLRCEGHELAAIYSSPLVRARHTAEEIGRVFELPVQTDDRLREHGVGQLTGLSSTQVEEQFPDWIDARQGGRVWVVPPSGEDRDAFIQRAVSVMTDIVAHHLDQTVAIVSHGGTLGVYLAHLLELPLHRSLPFQFDNTGLSIVRMNKGRMRLVRLNDTGHLSNCL